jgi:hypothetical protein
MELSHSQPGIKMDDRNQAGKLIRGNEQMANRCHTPKLHLICCERETSVGLGPGELLKSSKQYRTKARRIS